MASAKTVLVIGAHPDDETFIGAGRARAALNAGDVIKVVVLTNGDVDGVSAGLAREQQSVQSAVTIGLRSDDVIFLGYGDALMRTIYDSPSGTQVYTSRAGQTRTYASYGLGGMDYHRYVFGVPGPYNRDTVLADLRTLLTNFRPDEIYTHSHFDAHGDHEALALFVTEALLSLKQSGVDVRTKLYQTMVWMPATWGSTPPWPQLTASGWTPLVPILTSPCAPGDCLDVTTMEWSRATRFAQPPEMRTSDPATNLKARAIPGDITVQNGWFGSWVRADEIYWLTDLGLNLAATAQVTASSEDVAGGRGAARAIDGVAGGLGGTAEATRDWVAPQGGPGTWIQLSWPVPVRVAQVNLFDRMDLESNVLAGTLTFSDGTSLPTGALPPNGRISPVTFAPKTVDWVRLTVDQAEGAVGLSELQVLGVPATWTANSAPHFVWGPVAATETIPASQSTLVYAVAHDVDGDALQYVWTAEAGFIQGDGNSATFTPPAVESDRYVLLSLQVLDGRGGTATNWTYVHVTPAPTDAVSIAPALVFGGDPAQGTLALGAPAPAGGVVVALQTSDPRVATVPSSVSIAGGATTATFPIATAPVAASTSVMVSASFPGGTRAATLTVTPYALSSLTVTPASVLGGTAAQGVVTLPAPASPSGSVVALASSDLAVASVPASVTVAAGATTASFPIATSAVATATPVTISGTFGTTASASLVVTNYVSNPNLLQAPERIGAAPWLVYGQPTMTLDFALAPDQTQHASRALSTVAGHALLQTVTGITAGQTYTFSFFARNDGGGAAAYSVYDNDHGTDIVAPTSYFQRISSAAWTRIGVTFTAPAGCTRVSVYPVRDSGPNVDLLLWGAKLELGSAMTGYDQLPTEPPPLTLSALAVAPATVTGGESAQATATLSGPAPAGGTAIALSTSSAAAAVPAGVTVPEGATTATFTVTTTPVATAIVATLSASLGDSTRTATLTVAAPAAGPLAVSALSFAPAVLPGGATGQGTVVLNAVAATEAVVSLSSGDPSLASVPSTVTVAAGTDRATFPVVAGAVPGPATVSITATYGASSVTSTLDVTSPVANANLLQAPEQIGATPWLVYGQPTMTLDFALAPDQTQHASRAVASVADHALLQPVSGVTAGQTYTFSFFVRNNGGTAASYSVYDNDHGADIVPPTSYFPRISGDAWTRIGVTFTAPAGCTNLAVYPIRDSGANVNVLLWGAKLEAGSAMTGYDALSTEPPPAALSTLTIAPTTVTGGASAQGTVTLSAAAPAGGAAVALSTSGAEATVPASVTVPQGATSAVFTVTTTAVTTTTSVTVSATFGGTRTATLTLAAAAGASLSGVTLSPTSVLGGGSSTGTVTLATAAPAGGATVSLVSSGAAVTVPATVTVAAGARTVTFPASTVPVASDTTVTVSAALGATTRTATLTVTAPTLSSVSVSPATLAGGSPSTGTVTLSGPAPEPGLAVTLASSNVAATVPPTVTVPAGGRTATFAISTTAVAGSTSVTISASLRGSTRNASLSLRVLSVSALSLSPTTVVGETPSTGTVTLNYPAWPGGFTVQLASSRTAAATVPASVVVPEGARQTTFPITTLAVTARTSPSITATGGGVTRSATLTVNAVQPASLALAPTTVASRGTSVATITLSAAATSQGTVVRLTSSNTTRAMVPASITVPAGATTATFDVVAGSVTSSSNVTISASAGGATRSATLTVTP